MQTSPSTRQVIIYTDGGCDPNPGPGGYGVVLLYGAQRKELSGGFRLTTNNRMEIYAAIQGLAALKQPCKVQLFSDSEYLVKAMSLGWVTRWRARGWRRNAREMAKNVDLWEHLLVLCQQHEVSFTWLRGHAGHLENERCDQLVANARTHPNLPQDDGYESSLTA